jgi:hypothetical protein
MRAALLLAMAALGLAQKPHELCSACHSSQVEDFRSHAHFEKGLSCDACHGVSEKHMKATGAAPPDRVAGPDEMPDLCGACHAAEKAGYAVTAHAKLVAARAKVRAPHCGTCHGVHNPRPAKNQCGRCHMEIPKNPAAGGHGNRLPG